MKREGQILIEVILAIFLLVWLVPKVEQWTAPPGDQYMNGVVKDNERILSGH